MVAFDWSMTDSEVSPKLMTQAAAPKELGELTVCLCKQSKCASRSCKCVKAELLCSPACDCECDSVLCENTVSLENQDEENMSDHLHVIVNVILFFVKTQ